MRAACPRSHPRRQNLWLTRILVFLVAVGEVSWQRYPATDAITPSPRSGHSITCHNGKAYVFGGCGVSDDGSKQEIFSETWCCNMQGETPQWEVIDVMGDVPPARWRHTATLLPDQESIFVFGGLSKGKRFNDSYVLSIGSMEWNIKETAGSAPHPRSHHTANLITMDPEEGDDLALPKHKIAIVGGFGGPGTSRDYFMDCHFLELDTWTWGKVPNIRGPQPKPRSDHCACLTRGLLIIMGGRGWSTGKTDPGFYNDVHVLDLKKSEKRARVHA